MLEKRKSSNSVVIGALLIAIIGMVVGYATLSATLSVNGTGTISSSTSFDVKFTGVTTTPTGRATSTNTTFQNNSTSSTFSFAVVLNQPGDKMVYTVTMKNVGTIDAQIGTFTNPAAWASGDILTYSVTGITTGTVIAVGATKTFTLTVEWPVGTNIPTTKTKSLQFQINFIQRVTSGS